MSSVTVGSRDDQGDPGAAESGVALLELDDRPNELGRWPLWTWRSVPLRSYGRAEKIDGFRQDRFCGQQLPFKSTKQINTALMVSLTPIQERNEYARVKKGAAHAC